MSPEQNSHRVEEVVELVGGGWKGVIAQASGLTWQACEDEFTWQLFSIKKLRLGHAAALLLFQGMKPQDYFTIDSFIRVTGQPERIIMGTGLHILLSGTPSKPGWVPVSLEDVTIGHISPVPDDLTRDLLLATMMRRIP
jgi:hypothetical protein